MSDDTCVFDRSSEDAEGLGKQVSEYLKEPDIRECQIEFTFTNGEVETVRFKIMPDGAHAIGACPKPVVVKESIRA